MGKRNRKVWSFKEELLTKSREAMLCAVQVFNNPNIQFKSESFLVLSNIAWTYLMHAYWREIGVEYRYFEMKGTKRKFDKTKRGAFKYWELERCLNEAKCPLDKVTVSNLRFLIGLRHEVEHQMTTRIDHYLSARFQACCLNYNTHIKKLFGVSYGIDQHLSFSLQFSTIQEEHAAQLREFTDLPSHIASFINGYDNALEQQVFDDIRYAYRVFYLPKATNVKGQADKVIEFIKPDSPMAHAVNKEYVLVKDREKKKLLPGHVVKEMKKKGFRKFRPHDHTVLWKQMRAKEEGKGFGVTVEGTWYWYENWLPVVEEHCKQNASRYT